MFGHQVGGKDNRCMQEILVGDSVVFVDYAANTDNLAEYMIVVKETFRIVQIQRESNSEQSRVGNVMGKSRIVM